MFDKRKLLNRLDEIIKRELDNLNDENQMGLTAGICIGKKRCAEHLYEMVHRGDFDANK